MTVKTLGALCRLLSEIKEFIVNIIQSQQEVPLCSVGGTNRHCQEDYTKAWEGIIALQGQVLAL